MSNANDVEFAAIAEELIYEFGLTTTWSRPKGTTWSVSDSEESATQDGDGISVFMTPRLSDKRSLDKFQNRIDGDSVGYVEPKRLSDSGSLFIPEPGMLVTFPGGEVVTIVAFNRIYSGEDAAVFMLLLRE